MRSNSSGISRKTELSIKFFLLLLALVLGITISLESKTHFLRLKTIEATPEGLLSNAVIWKNVTEAERDFWPLLIFKKADYEKEIETNYPVESSLQILGWGKIGLHLECMEPIIKLGWDGQYWYLSENGKMWQADMEENSMLTLSKVRGAPVLYWGNEKTTPYEVGNAERKIKTSVLPVEQLMDWYVTLNNIKWLDKILAIKAETNDGIPVVRLIFKNAQGMNGVAVLLPEDSTSWTVVSLAISKICPDLTSLSQNDFIDATYKDRIMVKNAVQ